MRIAIRILLAAFAVAALLAVGVIAAWRGWLGRAEQRGEVTAAHAPAAVVESRADAQRAAAEARGVAEPAQILFGDLHVHTTFSFDAFLTSIPLLGGTGAHPPADACDFARYCSGLDFWSINDHAESLTPRLWQETIESLRLCNAAAGDPADPDLVSYLGWEWSQIGLTPEDHYGHRNVVLPGLTDDAIPARPIAARMPIGSRGAVNERALLMLGLLGGSRGRDFVRFIRETVATPSCPDGVPVRELPGDCRESAATPEELFAKLHDWGFPSLVIPHGTAWGFYTPPGSSWAKQLPGHDPSLQTMVEIYSGHGNSEEYRDWRAVVTGPDGEPRCPEPTPDYLPSCWRAGQLVWEECRKQGLSNGECQARAEDARQNYVDAGLAGWLTLPGHRGEAWLDAGQCRDCFLPAFNYRPASSVQYMLAIRDFTNPGTPRRFDFGFMASSDNHTARPGTGYKEFGRGQMTEGAGRRPGSGPPAFLARPEREPAAESVPFDFDTTPRRTLQLFETERGTSYLMTGGLIAVHARGRSREAIWNALERKQVYATSGPRILLWFDLLDDEGAADVPMGASARRAAAPRFRVRAVGSLEQRPGCPEWAGQALGSERLEALCLGECYHPSDRRRRLQRIEVVRIRPQVRADEPIAPLIDDPWQSFACPPDPGGCEAEFSDPEFAASGRDALYYVRAIEVPSLAVRADPLGCTRDSQGRCVAVDLCNAATPRDDDCLAETEERAWSSPIFVEHAPAPAAPEPPSGPEPRPAPAGGP